MKWCEEEALTFDDVLLVPRYCEIHSRQEVSTVARLTKKIYISIPIITANMDSVTESEMILAMHCIGGAGILHRFMDLEKTEKQLLSLTTDDLEALKIVSIGLNGDFVERLNLYKDLKVDIICIDVAHGWCDRMISVINNIKNFYPEVEIIAGNVGTPKATRELIKAGADAIKVGIGPGSMCTTRLVTGCGVPQLSAIIECAEVANELDTPIIADGGVTKSGDIVKALAAGASTVMIGSLIAGTNETPGEALSDIISKKTYKRYRGMASNDAMIGWKGSYHAAPEGESKIVECKGPVIPIIDNLVAGLRSGMTYCNARSIKELQENAVFRKVSANSLTENRPHGL